MKKDNPLNPSPRERRRRRMLGTLRNSFLTGLVVVAPIGLTFWLIWTVVGWVDGFVLPLVPSGYRPDELLNWMLGNPRMVMADGQPTPNPNWINVNVRGLGVVVFLLFTVLVGWIAKGVIGRSVLSWGEGVVDRTPVVRSIYSGVKQIAETVFNQTETSFEKACLVQYPRPGLWAIAFISTNAKGEIAEKVPRDDAMLSVFLPTTPNPTSGFLLFVPEADVVILDMSVEDAAKLVISAGLVYPNGKEPPQGGSSDPVVLPVRERMDA